MKSTTLSAAALALAALALSTPLVPVGALPAPDSEGDAVRVEVVRILTEETVTATIESELAARGAAALPILLAALADRAVTHPDGERVALDERQEAAVLGAFGHYPLSSVRSFLRSVADGEPPALELHAAIRVLASVGEGEDVPLLTRLCEPPAGERSVARGTRLACERALRTLVDRDPAGTIAGIDGAFREAHPALAHGLIKAAGGARSAEALKMLAGRLGSVRGADALLLAEIGRVGDGLAKPVDETVLANVRRYLDGTDTSLVIEAAIAAGKLDDPEAVPTLIELLDESRGLGGKALASLQRITAARPGKTVEVWRNWYAEQMRWWHDDAYLELRSLAVADPGDVSAALLEVSRRRLFRHELSKSLLPVLGRDETDLVVMCCATLGHLGSRLAVPALVDRLEDDDPRVQAAVHAALKQITGEDHGKEAASWREAAL